ncbi:MAG: hypothetical protein NW214_02520 [Pseudanabaenaceae cyanobacterium bins.39]|nr:hypothetical protein [Pseudanabaenaceae cyanobacterium bins.39]
MGVAIVVYGGWIGDRIENIARISSNFNIVAYCLENLYMLTKQRLELLEAIAQTPDEYVPELLDFVHFFYQQRVAKSAPTRVWDAAINEINNTNPEKQNLRRQRINQLFTTWAILDSEDEQKDALKIIESVEGVSI